ncbi:MAG: hypothetical protein N2312_01295 [Dictyoglomaceae bacterium]|nr:hypothetical protein [Dictyoglomaceae bacterium]
MRRILHEKKYCFTKEEIKRYLVIQNIVDRKITLKEAQKILNLSYRQMIRIKKRFISGRILIQKKLHEPRKKRKLTL